MKKINLVCLIILILFSLTLTLFAAQKTFTSYTWDRNVQVSAGGNSWDDDDSDFPPVVNDEDDPTITVDPETGAISLGNSMNRASGAIWYGGTTTGCNPCTSGVCPFGLGFRAYFEFKFTTTDTSTNSTTYGDGFNFIIANTSNNDVYTRGGSPNSSVDMGELIGYAGSGNTSSTSSEPRETPPSTLPLDGLGIKPPKIGIEFDTYGNTGAITYNGCSGGRQDNGSNNHVSLMFWGQSLAGNCNASSTAGNTFPQASFDDNIHRVGDGSTSNPYNSAASGNGSGLGGYYERARDTYNWLEDGQWHRARIEVIGTPSSATYQVKAWIDCELYNSPYTACPAGEFVYFQNVLNPYDNGSYLPKINRTQDLAGTFNNIIFGFTVATGGATQNILINNFAIYFPPSTVGTPSNLSFTPSGGSGTVSVTAVTGCTWTTSNNGNTWITVIPASSTGTGSPQTVNYTVANNTGPARTGTMTIAGQTFTVTQTGCTYTVGTPSNLSFAASGGSGTVSVTATTGCTWTTSNNGNTWITVIPASSTGTGSAQTVNYTVAANATGIARTGTMTIAGQTFTVTQAAGPPTCTLVAGTNIVPYNSTNNLTWSVSGTATTAGWTTSPGGTCGSPNPAGGSCTTATQTTAGARTFTLNVSNANGSSSCSTTFYVGCQEYRVWNGLGARRDFYLNSGCRSNINNNSEITQTSNRLNPGGTIGAYSTAGSACSTSLGISLDYNDAMNVDIAINGGNSDCLVNFTGNHTATDR